MLIRPGSDKYCGNMQPFSKASQKHQANKALSFKSIDNLQVSSLSSSTVALGHVDNALARRAPHLRVPVLSRRRHPARAARRVDAGAHPHLHFHPIHHPRRHRQARQSCASRRAGDFRPRCVRWRHHCHCARACIAAPFARLGNDLSTMAIRKHSLRPRSSPRRRLRSRARRRAWRMQLVGWTTRSHFRVAASATSTCPFTCPSTIHPRFPVCNCTSAARFPSVHERERWLRRERGGRRCGGRRSCAGMGIGRRFLQRPGADYAATLRATCRAEANDSNSHFHRIREVIHVRECIDKHAGGARARRTGGLRRRGGGHWGGVGAGCAPPGGGRCGRRRCRRAGMGMGTGDGAERDAARVERRGEDEGDACWGCEYGYERDSGPKHERKHPVTIHDGFVQ
ncbi:hypothetical protein C8R47DRAFT_193434 [Mycena vitilis]|nr:hypothetical protein C8R47DRAFT_193434 [Mycena vitilis]